MGDGGIGAIDWVQETAGLKGRFWQWTSTASRGCLCFRGHQSGWGGVERDCTSYVALVNQLFGCLDLPHPFDHRVGNGVRGLGFGCFSLLGNGGL